jgi:uncharacterized protein YneF (UPF0154 family)
MILTIFEVALLALLIGMVLVIFIIAFAMIGVNIRDRRFEKRGQNKDELYFDRIEEYRRDFE